MSFCKYSEGSWTEWDVKWKLSWANYMLYLASIPTYSVKEKKEKIEVKDSDDIF